MARNVPAEFGAARARQGLTCTLVLPRSEKKKTKEKKGKKKSTWNNIALNAATSFDPVRVAYLCNVSHLSPKTPLAVAAAP